MTHTTTSRFRNKPTLAASLAAVALAIVVGCTTEPKDDPGTPPPPPPPETLRDSLILEGDTIFHSSCTACHGHDGSGESGPPLLHSDYLIEQRMRPARILLMGLPNDIDTNPIVVNGIEHNNTMFAIATQNSWTDREIAAVLTYVRAELNDSTSVNCEVSENQDGVLVSDCDIVASPADATTEILPSEIATLRDSLETAGLLNP